tara:strand:- start:1228 stop:2748 length:1521 start_codon:yes stop_codon:yes gene_type:complete
MNEKARKIPLQIARVRTILFQFVKNRTILLQFVKSTLHALVGAFIVILILAVVYLNGRDELKIWHTATLDAEFTESTSIKTFREYLALEDRLFSQLDEQVYSKTSSEDRGTINRYRSGSPSDPNRWPINWNRSFELIPEKSPEIGVLLIHGLSDSPYSLRTLGQRLEKAGAYVLGLRVPGHGTAPSGLTTVTYQDMAAAVKLAMHHLSVQTPGKPLYIVGYSNGGALAVHYALTALEEPNLPTADGLILLSPEIGVTAMAGLAVWQERIGRLLGLKKLAWNDILPEYDPFKYTSFAVNAGNLVYQITGVNRAKIAKLGAAGKLDDFPSVLAFQSAVDATVSAPALVQDLFAHLPEGGHELVVFDLNRMAGVKQLLKADPKSRFPIIRDLPNRSFVFSLLTNKNDESAEITVRHWRPAQSEFSDSDPKLAWPEGIYSLSHVALPFSGKDPVYGGDSPNPSPGIQLGTLALRGEKGVLQISSPAMLRLRWNPFYDYLEDRVIERLKLN